MKALTDVQVEYALKTTHSRWRLEGKFIRRDFVFKNFVEAWGFMNSVAYSPSQWTITPIGRMCITR